MEKMEINMSYKLVNKFYCEKCHYECSRKHDYNKHLLTAKHNMEMYGNSKVVDKYECNTCNKIFYF